MKSKTVGLVAAVAAFSAAFAAVLVSRSREATAVLMSGDQRDHGPELHDYREPELQGKLRKLAEVLPSQALPEERHAEAVRRTGKLR